MQENLGGTWFGIAASLGVFVELIPADSPRQAKAPAVRTARLGHPEWSVESDDWQRAW